MNRRMLPALLVVAVVLVVVENYLYFQATSEAGRNSRGRGAQESALQSDPEEGLEGEGAAAVGPPPAISVEQLHQLLAGLAHERSPFLAEDSAPDAPGLRHGALPDLGGTLIGDGRRVAWMDGQPRGEGEQYGSFVVKEIDEGRVTLLRDGRPYTLELETNSHPLEEAR